MGCVGSTDPKRVPHVTRKDETQQILARSADPARGKIDLKRFEAAHESAKSTPFDWAASGAITLLSIFGSSPILAERLIANPIWADEIIRSISRGKRKSRDEIDGELKEMISSSPNDDTSFLRTLRHYKYREMTRLVSEDLAGKVKTRAMLAEWSDIADSLIDAAYSYALTATVKKYGISSAPSTGVILGLGKLGARELNLSSDIDILVIYDTDEPTIKDQSTTNHEFFTKLALELTRILSTGTQDGFVFRVDHELRPEGPQGPLANSVDAALRYYEYFGHDWERQALIRARPVAGDISLGMKIVEEIKPFVFRRSISIGDLSHMRTMKEKMARKATKRGQFDVKHGVGGIRELEFLVQTLQVLHGGSHPTVRNSNTFDAINSLSKESLIHPYGAELLRRAYSFLRRLENMIQAAEDLQKHAIPSDDAGVLRLARRMGFYGEDCRAREELKDQISLHTSGVHRLFDALFEADYARLELEEAVRDNISRARDEEEEADSLAWFKHGEVARLAELDLEGKIPLQQLQRRLTLVAEVIISCAWEMAKNRLVARYGEPRRENGERASFGIIGMGSLGAMAIDYGSDLDMCFLYSGDGSTDGKRSISNVEFFTKLAQRIMSLVSLTTRYGRAYMVDSELRPSGQSGALITSIASFLDYHSGKSQIWERLSLLKARTIAGDAMFMEEIGETLTQLAYRLPAPPTESIRDEIMRLRNRSVGERTKGQDELFNMKVGKGGLADLESVIQFYHLQSVAKSESLWRQNAFEVIDELGNEGIIDEKLREGLTGHLVFLRRLILRTRLITQTGTDILPASGPQFDTLAAQLGYVSSEDLKKHIDHHRAEIRETYDHVFGISSDET